MQVKASSRRQIGPASGGYVAYMLTPNMWEGPWVRHLLSELPISRYEVRDLWSAPPAHARVRRLQIRLESLVPGPLRPIRRMLRRLIKPESPSVVVYQTWGLDPAVRVELRNLLSQYDDIGVVSVDEPMRDAVDTYTRVSFGVRVGFGAAKYQEAKNLLVVPLGAPNNFVRPESPKPIHGRPFSWAFLGDVKNESRRKMVEFLESVGGEHFLHTTSGWESVDALRGKRYSDVLADAVFAPSPPANVHLECYRTYEVLECGAIPVVNTAYYCDEFEAPFPVVASDWSDAPQILNRFLDDPAALGRLDEQTRRWWDDVKRTYPERIRALAARARTAL
jgi:hypothetical protein